MSTRASRLAPRAFNSTLITGGAGFIGSHFVDLLLAARPDTRVVTLDALTYAGSRDNLTSALENPRHTFVEGDIQDAALVKQLFAQHHFDSVVHFAAESHVDRSISDPMAFVKTNVLGTGVLLDAARNAWFEKPHAPRSGKENARFHHISTDEVFGSLGATGYFSETTPYAPNSPYSASKAASDHLVRSYHHTYGMDVTTSNCSNNYGERQHAEKLIPTIIRKALSGAAIPIYGDGRNVRDWLYVGDHCAAVLEILERGRAGEVYCIGSNNEQNNNTIAALVCGILDSMKPRADGVSYAKQIQFVADRPGHDARYAIDGAKLTRELGWTAATGFESGLRQTLSFYVDNFKSN